MHLGYFDHIKGGCDFASKPIAPCGLAMQGNAGMSLKPQRDFLEHGCQLSQMFNFVNVAS
jgi:hypothetical protein